ncbi:hypothetical protein AOC36_01260 [Erysipelothrix larvae]|uniref:CsbD-like domain-containing protein n=1 Tax=Erysipelothrix larvae TaxID=1514105 RepID=A0A0X8GYB2_9FIRM|nr:CsbD family protein [Erysipelothrix larvae]AMC92667.1 hypothetical protein AOC36_01260 [Erysipelothrix larvae]
MPDNSTGDKIKGKVKETVGDLTGDTKTKAEGIFDQAVGKVKEVAHDVKEKAEDVAHDVFDKAEDVVDDIKDKFNK